MTENIKNITVTITTPSDREAVVTREFNAPAALVFDAVTKADLIKRLADANPHLYPRDIQRIVDTVFEQIGAALARGDRVELRGFGAFPPAPPA